MLDRGSVRVVDDDDTVRALFQDGAWGLLPLAVAIPVPRGIPRVVVCPSHATVQLLVLLLGTDHSDSPSLCRSFLLALLTRSDSEHGAFVSAVVHHVEQN